MLQVIGPTVSEQWRLMPSLFLRRELSLNLSTGLVQSSSLQRDGKTVQTTIHNTNNKGRQHKHANQEKENTGKHPNESKTIYNTNRIIERMS